MASLVATAGCEITDQMVGPEESPTVVMGRVASVSSSTEGSSAPAASSLGGIEVTVRGDLATDVTGEDGSFRLVVDGQGGPIALRFRRGSLDVELELSGIPSGGELRIQVRLDDSGASILDDDGMEDGPDEFDGSAALLSLEGEASARTALLEVTDTMGSTLVEIREGGTVFDAEGDIHAFADLVSALEQPDPRVRIEGRGSLDDQGVFIATAVKAEVDEDEEVVEQDDNDDGVHDFDGVAALLTVTGQAPGRTVLVELEGTLGTTLVQVVEGVTLFDGEGDVLAFADLWRPSTAPMGE